MNESAAERFRELTGTAGQDSSGSEGGFISRAMAAFGAAAASGNLRLSDEAGYHLLRAVKFAREELQPVLWQGEYLTQERKLGHSVQAERLKRYLPSIADGHPESMLTQIRNFLAKLDDFEKSIYDARSAMDEYEQRTVNHLRSSDT